ncbi:amino acid permease [Shigella flexneri]
MALLAGISATSWSYTGMASICYMTGEIKNPGKTMPRALIGSCPLVLVLYTLLALVISGLMPFDKLANLKTPISTDRPGSLRTRQHCWDFVAITAMIVILGLLSSCVMYQPRLEYVMAKDNLFFKCSAIAPQVQHAGCLHHPARALGISSSSSFPISPACWVISPW